MIVHRLPTPAAMLGPYRKQEDDADLFSDFGDPADSDPYGYRRALESLGTDECWYWYNTPPYEGSGALILRRGGEWAGRHLGHCSCYGPLDFDGWNGPSVDDGEKWAAAWRWFPSLAELQASGSDDWWDDFAPLATAIAAGELAVIQ